MKIFVVIIFFLLPFGLKSLGQSYYIDLKDKISDADSIVAISYESKGDSIQGLEYLLKEKDFFSSHLKAKQILNQDQRTELISILTKGQRILGRKSTTRYFKPKNAILFYKDASLSYIDICFSCQRIETTKDIVFDDFDIETEKWKALKQYFKNLDLIDE